ncbi:protein RECOGNITION OF PERONOSPORA PARASITICA 7-like [Lycium barbarum]|uniref:protein RECOGNITION OF PERONOSPORA PARASITICA 7-like n=1 Tax=Lycium barbarum TaxID=112863 RepID=UPI00293EF31C|nr:protein RECOGNITION OF PERONOSPORA PARASITICA 7-like [Lycium barbarum]
MSELELRPAVERLRFSVLAKETARLSIVNDHLYAIQGELNQIQLLKGDIQCISGFEDKVWRLGYLTYQVVDIIETYHSSTKTGILKGIKTIFMRGIEIANELQQIRSKIEQISDEILEDAAKEKDRGKMRNFYGQGKKSGRPVLPNNLFGDEVQMNSLFGLEKDKEKLGQVLLSGTRSDIPESSSSQFPVPIIPICGVVGSGKTTLAKLIYHDPIVCKEFGSRLSWIDVSGGDILQKIHESVLSQESLTHKVFQKSLIVLDDVRSIEAWETLSTNLPRVETGSKILVTTRAGYIAEYISPKQYIHKMKPLNEDDSWALFTEVYTSRHPGSLTDEMINKGKETVKTCGDLPQLIKELALFLASENTEWNMVHKYTQTCMSKFFSTVYNELSAHLKPCFFYLGLFLEDQVIDPERLSHLWMIECLLSTRECDRGKRMMDVTEQYLRELELKGLVEVQEEEVPFTQKFKGCSIVKGIEKLCLSSGERKRFLKVIDLKQSDCSLSSIESHRLVISLGDYGVVVGPQVAEKVRTLRIVGNKLIEEKEFVWPAEMLNLKKFRVLRILDFDRIDFQGQKLPPGIFDLVLLRYLSFKGCVLEGLPSSISQLSSYLQILDLRVKDSSEVKIANVLEKLVRLNHLYLPLRFRTPKGEKLRLDSLTELETLVNFNTGLCRANDVLKLCKLRHLTVKVEGNFEDFESITNYMKTTSNNLLHSSIDIINMDCYAEERHSVLRQLLQCPAGRIIHFEGYIGCLPSYAKISQSFTQLILKKSDLREDPMSMLEKLPNLGGLVLSDDAYTGKVMACSALGFPKFKRLELLNLPFLEKWMVEDKAMPQLSTLKISNCSKLEILPKCLQIRASGHSLEIIWPEREGHMGSPKGAECGSETGPPSAKKYTIFRRLKSLLSRGFIRNSLSTPQR